VMLALGAALVAAPGRAQDSSEDLAGPPVGPEDPGRLVYVPLWVEPLGNGARRAGRGTTADAVWISVPLGATDRPPEREMVTGATRERPAMRVRLRAFRLSAPSRAPGEARELTALVSVLPFRPDARPSLTVTDPESALESQVPGRLVRRAGDTAEYVFVAREPFPPSPPMANPTLRREMERTEGRERFDLRLSLNLSARQAPRADTGRR